MIFETFKKRKHVRIFDTEADVPKELIDSILRQTVECTPSKQNFMAYNVFVFGPDAQLYKEEFHRLACHNEHILVDPQNPNESDQPENYEYKYIVTAPYVLVFCKRWEDEPNEWQRSKWEAGKFLEPMDKQWMDETHNLLDLLSLEAGLFTSILTALCIENELDVSYTCCFPRQKKYWKHMGFVMKDDFYQAPFFIMGIGKAQMYRIEGYTEKELKEQRKPSFERIVKYVD